MKTLIALFAVHSFSLFAQSYTISTFAGGGAPPTSVPATSVRVPISVGLAIGKAGEIYFSSGNAVMKVDTKGILTRIAGTGQYGLSNDGGPALNAQLEWPAGLALDGSGNLYVVENAAHRVRKVSPEGIISTVAGTGVAGNSGDGGPATSAQFNWPSAIAVDAAGDLYISDTLNKLIRKVSPDGIITTIASNLNDAEGVAVDASGNVYVADHYLTLVADPFECDDYDEDVGRILKITAGVAQTLADGSQDSTPLSIPRGLAVDASGNVYVSDVGLTSVFAISPGGAFTKIAGGTATSQQLNARALAVDTTGNLYIPDSTRNRIAKMSPQGDLINVVGDGFTGNYWSDGGKATDSALLNPLGLALDNAGDLFIADSGNNRIRKVSPDGTITTFAGNGTPGFAGDGGPATSAQLSAPAAVALDNAGDLFIADSGNNRIRKVATDGTITTIAGRGDYNPPLGDGGPATSAALAEPLGVAVDATGTVYIADSYFFLVRKVSPEGTITTIAGSDYYNKGPITINLPTGVTLDAEGNLLIADGSVIHKLSVTGAISTIAGNGNTGRSSGDGGPATNASLQGPFDVAVDTAGNLYISGGSLSGFPLGNGYVRKVGTDGIITTIAGNGTVGFSGDGGPAVSASFSAATGGIAVDATGTVYVADVFNNVIRVLRPASN